MSGPKLWRVKKFERPSTNFQRSHVRVLRERYTYFIATVNPMRFDTKRAGAQPEEHDTLAAVQKVSAVESFSPLWLFMH
jgi:hypothetical protein